MRGWTPFNWDGSLKDSTWFVGITPHPIIGRLVFNSGLVRPQRSNGTRVVIDPLGKISSPPPSFSSCVLTQYTNTNQDSAALCQLRVQQRCCTERYVISEQVDGEVRAVASPIK